jgi:probable DNA repair protein
LAQLHAAVYRDLIQQLARGATVVTPNRRLAGAIRAAFDEAQSLGGRTTWPAADVIPWNAWLERAYREAFFNTATTRALASAQQEALLWRRVVEESNDGHGLLQLSATTDAALEAWRIAYAWRLLPALASIPLSEESAAFLRWAKVYERLCTEQRLLDHARVADTLRDLAGSGKCKFGSTISLFGFDQLDPQQRALLETLSASGISVQVSTVSEPRCTALVAREAGVESEIRLAARWARSRLAAQPACRVAVVVPELTRLRSQVLRVFDEELVPGLALQPGVQAPRPWNVSLGIPLAQWPLIHAALLFLNLASDDLPAESVSVLLRSEFLGGARQEADARALLDVKLRRQGDPRWSLQGLEYQASEQQEPGSCSTLAQALLRFRTQVEALPGGARPLSFWGPALQSLLAALGWPGERELDSHEYQAFVAWKQLLCELPQLDLVCTPVRLREAIETVGRLARERVFQPESPPVPIQILGPLESAQLEFDHIWVLGLTDEVWPRAPRANPLLPIELQRQRGIPRSSAQWELGFARRMQTGWEACAREVVLSWHESNDDRALCASPLLGGLADASSDTLRIAPMLDWRAAMYASAKLEEIADWRVSELPHGVSVAGGARVLHDQAACAFRAFAAHRLHARALEHPQEGLSARDRGVILHAALAHLWGELKSAQRLNEIEPDELRESVERAVAHALRRVHRRQSSMVQARFIELERERLCVLLGEWLDVERARAPFEVVAREDEHTAAIGGLELKLRLDRVDRLVAGDELLIDYKSGESKLASWFGERPDEPQLPLYAITRRDTPSALAFAHVARGDSRLLGLAARDDVAAGIVLPPNRLHPSGDWAELMDNWRAILERLAVAFRSGVAVVAPKKRNESCSLCDYALVCRVSELLDRRSTSAGPARG